MSDLTESSASAGRANEPSTECKPLLDAATKDLFRKNAFRITGLPVDATTRDLAKHAEKLKVLAELGQDPQLHAALPLRPPATVEDIREAIQKLKDPQKRLIDEFFWFWPEEFGQSRSDAALQALEKGDLGAATEIWMCKRKHPTEGVVATHNLALIFHILALDWENYSLKKEFDAERQDKVNGYWKAAFYRWKQLVTNEQLWSKVVTRISQLNEPNLTIDFARQIRATLPTAFDKPNAELAVAFAKLGKVELARRQIKFMGVLNDPAHADRAAELVLTPMRNRLREHVRQAKERADKNPNDALAAGRQLLEHARDPLALFDLFLRNNSHFRNDVFDEIAALCNRLQVAYHKTTDDNQTCLEFLKLALPFAASTDLRLQIEENIKTLDENIENARKDKIFYANLTPISSAPSLSTINGIGTTLYGSSDVDPRNASYLTTYYFTFLGIPIFPICRYRVIRNGKSYRFLGKAPLRSGDKWHLAIVIGFILLLIIAGVISGNNNSLPSSKSTYTSSPPTSSRAYTQPSFNGPKPSGNAYQVPSSANSALFREKAEIESERPIVQGLENQVENLSREIERERPYLDRTNEFEVDAFNAKVGRYNILNQQAQRAQAAFNEKVDSYNAKVRASSR